MHAPAHTELWHTLQGSGPPLLLMHGGLGWDHSYFRPALDALGDAVQLIYYDHRGNGRSVRPSDWGTVDDATWVEDAERLREALGLEKIFLLGHSYGGFLAQEYALRYPERLLGLVLCCTAPALDYVEVAMERARARATPEQVAALVAVFSAPSRSEAEFRAACETILPLYFHQRDSPEAQRIASEMVYSAEAFNRCLTHTLPGFSTRERLGGIHVPTLVLAGGDDWIMPREHSADLLHAGVRGSELVTFERSGHFPFLEEPERFRSVLREWVGRVVG